MKHGIKNRMQRTAESTVFITFLSMDPFVGSNLSNNGSAKKKQVKAGIHKMQEPGRGQGWLEGGRQQKGRKDE
jgi:hypothetical protein